MPLVVYVLGLAIFSIGTSELMVAGMMPAIAEAFQVTIGDVGLLISYFAFGVMFGGPALTYLFLKFKAPYRGTLLTLLILYTLAQALSSVVTSFNVLLVIRVILGILCAGCLSLSLATSMSLVAPKDRPRAASIVIGGFMLSNVLGVPFATIFNEHYGWQLSFGIISIAVFICFIALFKLLPILTNNDSEGLNAMQETKAFKNMAYWKACLTSCLILGASFAAFSYFVPILTNISNIGIAVVPYILMCYGATNIVGNMITGRLAFRFSLAIMVIGLTILTGSLVGMALFVQIPALAIMFVILIGLSGVPMNPAMMARIVSVAHPGPMVNAVHTSVINIGLGGGSLLGGMAITAGYGLRSPLWIGAALALCALISVLPYVFRKKSGWD